MRHLITRRAVLATLAAPVLVQPRPVLAQQTYPDRPIRFVVPFPPGGPTGALGRLLAEEMSRLLGQPIVVDNRGGAGGAIGAENVARARPDGYTLLFGTAGTHTINPVVQPQLGYDPVQSFAPVAAAFASANVVLVHPSHPAKTLAELLAGLRAAGEPQSFGSGGSGTTPHMTMELLRARTSVNLVHVPYRGSGPMLSDLIAGHITLGVDGISTALPHIQAGTLRALGISSRNRSTLVPDLPAISEVVPDYEAIAWWGVFAPAGTSEPIVTQLNGIINRLLGEAEFRSRLAAMGVEPLGGSPAELASRVERERRLWAEVVQKLGLRFD